MLKGAKCVGDRIAPVAAEIAAAQFDAGRGLAAFIFRNIEQPFDPRDRIAIEPARDQLLHRQFFLHQANEKMDESFIKVLYKLYGLKEVPADVMPMSIHTLGNSSVATIPTLLDLVKRGILTDHSLKHGDVILFASVGAGMNINAVCYRV